MEELVSEEVLYETHHHLTRPFSSNYPPQQQDEDGGVKGGFLSMLTLPGVSQLKGKWNEYKSPRKLKKWISLCVSPRGEHVAVSAGNQITILQKSDNYKEPCGIFNSYGRHAIFTFGAWSDSHDVLGAIDDTDTLYFIKANGEEMTRITKKQLKISSPIIGLIVQGDPDANTSVFCSFSILTLDGVLHPVEVSQKPQAFGSSIPTSNDRPSVNKHFPQNVSCLDYHPEFSLLVIAATSISVSGKSSDSAGFYCLSLWNVGGNLDIEPVFCSPQFEGLFSIPKGYVGPLTTPKVTISPQSKFVAALDLTGGLDVFKLDDKHCSLSIIDFHESLYSQTDGVSNGKKKCLSDITDVTWWTDHILIVAKKSGVVSMFDVFTGKKLLEGDQVFSMPVLERVRQCQGCVFLLESIPSEERGTHLSSSRGEIPEVKDEGVPQDGFHQLDVRKLSWSLLSFSKKSVTEMYSLLIGNQQYQAAMDFANHHGLDRDEIFKSQWLHSAQGTNDVNKYLSNIKDQGFVLSECVDNVGQTEEAVKALLAHGLRITDKYKVFLSSEDDGQSSQIWDFCIARLQLLQLRDRLETFVGINMGRFSVQEFNKFRAMPLNEAAVSLAESGKIGALNLLFKRHPYSLAPFTLDILAAIPETVPIQTYGQLLPGRSPTAIALRENDWVECEKMVNFINKWPRNHYSSGGVRTEPIVKQSLGFVWPSIDELSLWYKNRAREMDSFTGQLDNCLSLLEFAVRKGILELQPFNESISYLYQLIYSNETDEEINITMSLAEWEQLSDYEKFKMMLDRVKEDSIVERLRAKAIPFMLSTTPVIASASEDGVADYQSSVHRKRTDSFFVRWLKEVASDNKLDICSVVIEEAGGDFHVNNIFRDEIEAVECALQCIYLCTLTDRWNTMASLLSKLPQIKDTDAYFESLGQRVKVAEGHVEAGRLLAYYQVPKPMSFFIEAHPDPKGVKQILRLILSKFGRRQPGRSDNDWANMWRDMQLFQEKAFPFLDLEYMLTEFCRGLLKAGRFSLARNYLKGTGAVALATEKAENLVIQAAREYFFSASSLACAEIWKAKECLSLFPNSKNVKAEADVIDALTIKLPNLGVTLLPMQFRQIKNPMEIINMVITSQIGAYLNVDELVEIAKLLGLSSPDDIAAVQEAAAREAAVAGDLQLAFDLCLVLSKKGHGPIWDLCTAIARGPALDNMDTNSRKQLLGFALSHCDEESVGELLHAWKDLDMQYQSESLMVLTGSPNFSAQGSFTAHDIQDISDVTDCSYIVERVGRDDQELHFEDIKQTLSTVANNLSGEHETSWESLLRENGRVLSFAALQLPWLLELSREAEYAKKNIPVMEAGSGKRYVSVRTQAVVTVLSWLARNDIAPNDDLITYLAKSVMEMPATKEEDILGCSFLLNLVDTSHGVEVIEEQVKAREGYHEVYSIMNMGMTYNSLHNSANECGSPTKRRELLMQKFREKPTPLTPLTAASKLKGLPSELQSNVQPCEGWDESQFTTCDSEAANQSESNPADANTLVALKSTRLAAIISSTIEITPESLLTLDSAISCFLNLSEAANTEPHFKALQAILEEWEGLFISVNDEEDPNQEVSDLGNNWNSEDWDEGWDSFQELQTPKKEGKKEGSVSVHPLHTCWVEIIKKLIALSQYTDVYRLIDRSLVKCNVILLDLDDTQSLMQLIVEVDCFAALKIALLLPYEAIQLVCLDMVESKLKQEGLSGAMSEDRELFTLFLSSGAISTIATNSAYGTTLSYFYYMAGHLSRCCQENQLSKLKRTGGEGNTTVEEDFFTLFRMVLFPCLISELVKINQPLLAGFLVSRFMHTNPSFSLLNIAEAIVRKYLGAQIQLQHDTDPDLENINNCMCLENTVSRLRGKLESSIHTALSSFSDTVK